MTKIAVQQEGNIFFYDSLTFGLKPPPVTGRYEAPIVPKGKIGKRWARMWFESWCKRKGFEPHYVDSITIELSKAQKEAE